MGSQRVGHDSAFHFTQNLLWEKQIPSSFLPGNVGSGHLCCGPRTCIFESLLESTSGKQGMFGPFCTLLLWFVSGFHACGHHSSLFSLIFILFFSLSFLKSMKVKRITKQTVMHLLTRNVSFAYLYFIFIWTWRAQHWQWSWSFLQFSTWFCSFLSWVVFLALLYNHFNWKEKKAEKDHVICLRISFPP